MRHQPDGYVRSFIDNKLVQEVEEDVVVEQLPYNVKCTSFVYFRGLTQRWPVYGQ